MNDAQSLVLFLQLFSLLTGNRPPPKEEMLKFIPIKIDVAYANPSAHCKRT